MSGGWLVTALAFALVGVALVVAGRTGAGAPVLLLAVIAAAVALTGGPPPDERSGDG